MRKDTAQIKTELRAIMRNKRLALSPQERRALSEAAAGRLLVDAHWQRASCVALYIPVRGETDTSLLLEDAWKKRKRVLLPLCSPHVPGEMRLAPCAGPKELVPGPFQILQPLAGEGYTVESGVLANTESTGSQSGSAVPDVVILPGLAFDHKGLRLGMGGGYYDRLLALPAFASCLRIGLAYGFQVVEALPGQEWDILVHALCTEQGILWM